VSGNPSTLLERFQPECDPFGEHMLAVHTESEARNGDADLRGGDVTILPFGVRQNAGNAQSEAASLRSLVFDTRARRANDGELRRDEQTVRQYEQQNDAEGDQNIGHVSVSPSSSRRRFARTDASARSATRSTSNS
jgi:hypothetical protein